MNEGFSDYFAASITNDPDIGEWSQQAEQALSPLLRQLESLS